VDILTAASTDCRLSGDLRQRLATVRELAARITRNTVMAPSTDADQGNAAMTPSRLAGIRNEILL
jgi:hypothetical protein